MPLNLALMENNITKDDLEVLIAFLRDTPRLTQGAQVRAFEEEWSAWLGVKHSVFLNSGASANLLTLAALRYKLGAPGGEIIVSPLNWVSDIAACLQNGFTPVFADINPRTLGMADDQIIAKITANTRAVLLTHIQGFNALTDRLLAELERRNIPLIEDVCESHGATHNGRKCGTFGWCSNFSCYFAHHMSTIEGGIVSTDDPELYQIIRMLRSHGMTRETTDDGLKRQFADANPDLSPDFIFAMPAYNCRNTEIGAVLGRNQLKRLNANNRLRQQNLCIFLKHLNPELFQTDFALEGSCNYAFNVILRKPDIALRDAVEAVMRSENIEFRRGSSGGGNQLRQPYLKKIMPDNEYTKYPNTDHVHFFGWYIGNYPGLQEEKILKLAALLNNVKP